MRGAFLGRLRPQGVFFARDLSQLRVAYGSQTGTAQMFATQLAEAARAKQWDVVVNSLDDDPEAIEADTLVVVTSVFGEGEPPDNAKRFYRSLMDSPHAATLGGRYAAFALGDSRYAKERFAIVGLNIDRELEQRGKTRIMPVSVGDAAGDIEADFDEFVQELLDKIGAGQAEKPQQKPDRLALVSDEREPTLYAPLDKNSLTLSCVSNRSVLPGTWKERPCAELQLACPEVVYQTGDYLGVYPHSNSVHVDEMVRLFRLDRKAWFSIESGFESVLSSRSKSLPNPVSVETFLSRYCDLQRPLQTSTLRKLAELASPEDKVRIAEGLDKEKQPFLFKSVPQVLAEYPSLLAGALGLEHLVALLPPQKPVYYSIASSALVSPKSCRLVVGQVQITPQLGGLCSSFLNSLAPGTAVEGQVQKSMFRLPADPKTPIVMVGVGSGLAPFLAFLEERALTGARNNTLFFGCMRPEQDFIYKEQLEKWHREQLLNLHVAFSHPTTEMVFVQHLMLQQRARLWDLISNQGAHIYMCGHVRMGKGVDEAIRDILLWGCNNSLERSTVMYDALYETQRLHSDVFA